MRKDILFLCQFFYPEYNSSATLPFDTAKYLSEHGLKVGALCGYPKEYNKSGKVPLEETVDGVEIKRIKYIELSRTKKINRLINYFSFTLAALFHIFMLRKYKCVVVYSNPPVLPIVPILARALFKTEFVFVAYDVYPEVAYASKTLLPGGTIDRVMMKINRRLYKNAAKVIALTDEMKDFLLEHRNELTEDRVETIANWAHEEQLEADSDAYARFGYKDKQFVVSYFGNMGTCQDVDTMLDAAEKLKDNENIKFIVVGHGNKKSSVEKRIETEMLTNVQVIDFLTGKDFEQAVAISSCSVVSLEKGLKGTCAPSKYYSYLQGGQPILAVVEKDSYLAKEVEEQEIGYSVEVGDSDSLKEAIERMSNSPEDCAEMGSRAKMLYDSKYDISIALGKYEKTLRSVIGD